VASRQLGPRSNVWAEPTVVEAAAWEFAETEQLLGIGEQLFGPYDWDRYDLLVLPPAFPFGGMENPRLTFLTPTLIAGDRSLIAVVAHELAHSWTGNLISNANAEHFWLNEGASTYAERRVIEAYQGQGAAELEWALGRRDLVEDIERLRTTGFWQLTRLRTRLEGIDPDDTFTVVPYEKGALLLRALELAVGRPAFDAFLREYIQAFRFGVLTSEVFADFAASRLGQEPLDRVDLQSWLFAPGLPPTAPEPRSSRLEAIAELRGLSPPEQQARGWSAIEWQLYLESISAPAEIGFLAELDRRFELTRTRNYDVLGKWLVLALRSRYEPADQRVEEVLGSVGRTRYLRQLYRALTEQDARRAQDLFERNAEAYHPITRQVISSALKSEA
jgi:aminopeptidase N